MNRWEVYEYVKRFYLRTGQLPTMKSIQTQFIDLDFDEIGEGYAEFLYLLKWEY